MISHDLAYCLGMGVILAVIVGGAILQCWLAWHSGILGRDE
jgi:hypothetical protein